MQGARHQCNLLLAAAPCNSLCKLATMGTGMAYIQAHSKPLCPKPLTRHQVVGVDALQERAHLRRPVQQGILVTVVEAAGAPARMGTMGLSSS